MSYTRFLASRACKVIGKKKNESTEKRENKVLKKKENNDLSQKFHAR